MQLQGIVTQIVRNSHVDGPGLRTVVFLKGCPLRCSWCHNPETQESNPEIFFDKRRCIECGSCIVACKDNAIIGAKKGRIDRKLCTVCMACVKDCSTLALEAVSSYFTVEKLLYEIKKDELLYKNSGGGVTFSGGEPLQQIDFLTKVLKTCKQENFHTTIDTCGAVPWKYFQTILPYVDLFLYDIKHTSNKNVLCNLVLENARQLSKMDGKIWFRIPLVPKFNATKEEVANIGNFIKSCGKVQQVNLLPFHNFPENKYEMLGRRWEYSNDDELSDNKIEEFRDILSKTSGYKVIVGG